MVQSKSHWRFWNNNTNDKVDVLRGKSYHIYLLFSLTHLEDIYEGRRVVITWRECLVSNYATLLYPQSFMLQTGRKATTVFVTARLQYTSIFLLSCFHQDVFSSLLGLEWHLIADFFLFVFVFVLFYYIYILHTLFMLCSFSQAFIVIIEHSNIL